MFPPTEGGFVNGRLSPEDASISAASSERGRSESLAPDAQSPHAEPSSPSIVQDPNGGASNDLHEDHDMSGTDGGSSGGDASDDADFEMQDSVVSPRDDGVVPDRESSVDSPRPPKRKSPVVEEDFIKANPELYGLRRSTRARETRQLIESDDSDSDIEPTTRRQTKRRRVNQSQLSSKMGTPTLQPSTNESDSDSDVYGGARAKSQQKKARLQRESQPSLAFVEKRWSNRRAAQQVQQGAYEESDFEDDEDLEQAGAYYVADYVDDSPYIEKVVRHRVKDGSELLYDSSRNDFDYFVKWQGKSHLHDTWETIESLRNVRGFRKVENYFRKVVEQELEVRFGYDVPPESKEQFFLDRERVEEAFEDFTKVERVVAVRDGDEETEYFVKWKGLTYEECTWELASDISADFQDKIDQYLDRASRSWQSDRREANPETRSRMTKLEEQPDYIQGGELRQFQLKGLNFLCLNWVRGNNVILADEMGLGKTVQTVSFLSWLRNNRSQEGPSLVVAPLSVIPAWCDTFNTWAPDLNYVVYLGPEEARNIIRENELIVGGNPKKPKFNVLVTSYEFILQDWQFLQSIKWQTLAVDEAHRLKNKDSQLYSRLVGFGVPCKVLITGTPIQNNLAELSALLDFLNPGKVNIDEDLDSLAANDVQEKLEDLHKAIAPYILRRTKETVESDLPPKTEKIIRVELSDVQLDYYKNILTRNYAALCDATGGHKNSLLNVMMELKKISNHPYMFPGAEERVLAGSTRREDQIKGLIASSGKMMLLDQLLSKLKKDGHRVLIFSQMVKMLDILGDYLSLRGYKFQRLDGTIAAGPRRMAINHFNADDSDDFCFLLSTRAGGLGINLMTADTVVIFDSDWNPQADLQAMARAHRIGQKRPVNIYRLVSKETVEEEVLERARNKLLLEYLTIQAGVTDDGKAAFKEKMDHKGIRTEGPSSSEDIQLVLKMRSSKMFEQSGNQERLEQLDIDSILENAEITKTKVDDKINLSSGGIDWENFMQITDVKVDDINLDWDQIIPADKLAEIKAEEKDRQHEEYVARLAAENAPRRATMKSRNKENDRADRLKKRQREQQQEEEEQRALLADPKRPLNDKEQRNLIKAYFRFGSMDHRSDDIIQEAKLVERDPEFVKSVLDDFIKAAQQALDENNSKVADEEKRTGKALTKKDRKAVLIDFGELKKVNAETAIERPKQLQLLRQAIRSQAEWRSFRLADATKGTNYSCPWGAKEDAMLLIGIDRHGFGAWVQIRDDPELEMAGKLFLEEHRVGKKEERSKANDKLKAPGAVHLVRRSEYLLSVLQTKHSGDRAGPKAGDGHHRNKKHHLANGHRGSGTASPAPHGVKKNRERERDHSHSDNHRPRSHADDRGSSRPEFKRKHASHDGGRSPKHRRTDDGRRPNERHRDTPRHRDDYRRDDHHRDDNRRDDRRRDDRSGPREQEHHEARPQDERRASALRRLDELRRIGDNKDQRDKDNDAMIWFLLKPVRANFERILSTTKENVKSSKERANIFGEELVAIGRFLDDKFSHPAGDDDLKNNFWDFLAALWPVDDTSKSVTGQRLGNMYRTLRARNSKQEANSGSARTNGAGTSR
ncbi:chromatin organization modifier domain-containing protein [Hirsutella rhossiliensis]|uniref:Chromo (CHRromatin organization MOdifier) domain-containing protein n=1 Tax=Hirsutella rhossiliensis TaxID=111463 RepID=A0A9P8SII3_9HYPO|nr:chromo (CHRromatin organization MOdifier) domain-containing protein [Hirsutella rhossiliensis]KAH0963214.1 chromo (CHRromatin organization MOdifier) domain-containing protein [Hirsutella rhossiliensis]